MNVGRHLLGVGGSSDPLKEELAVLTGEMLEHVYGGNCEAPETAKEETAPAPPAPLPPMFPNW